MRRIPTLLEVERRHILNTLHLCGNNRSLTARVLGLSVRGLRIKLHQYEKAGFVIAPPLGRDDVCRISNICVQSAAEIRMHGLEFPAPEAATTKVIEELMSVVEAIGGAGSARGVTV